MTTRLHVETVGNGPPLVLLHGWAMHSGVWGDLPERLGHRFRVHSVDLPGHGFSDPLQPLTLDSMVEALSSRFAGAKEPLTVAGWSLGGMVALRWARRSPAAISRLVLVATTPAFVAREDWPHAMSAARLDQFGDELRVSYRLTLQRFLSLQLAGNKQGRATLGSGSGDGRAMLATLRRDLFARGEPAPEALVDALRILGDTDLRAEVPTISTPAVVVSGECDSLTPAAAGAWLADALPHGRFALIEGAGHLPFLSHPDAFVKAFDTVADER